MPEGDTVWLHARRLDEALGGRVVVESDFRVPQLATADVAGWQVAEVASRGKHLLHRFVGPAEERWTLHSHLRMDGTWRTFKPGERWTGRPLHTVRVVLRTTDRVAVGFHLHDVALVRTEQEDTLVGHLGPDLLGADWDADEAVRRLGAAPARPIGEAVIDQRCLAGIGTVWRAEVLFLRGVNPWTPAGLVDLPPLVALAHRLLMANREGWPQVTTGNTRRGEGLYVYGRAGQPCRRCGAAVRRGEQGPVAQERVTYWCPMCQPGEGE